MGVATFLAVVAVVLTAAAQVAVYAGRVLGTDRRLLAASRAVRAGRRVRAVLLRAVLAVPAAPHLVELSLGLHRTPVATTPKSCVWQDGPARLWRYEPLDVPQRGLPVLLVHSLVTRPWVLDLVPGCSLVGSLLATGRPVLLLDWGRADRTRPTTGLDAYVDVLRRAEQAVSAAYGGGPVHEVGYCFGGTLAAALHAVDGPARLASLALVASPIETAVPGGMGPLLRRAPSGLLLDGDGMVPGAAVREAFHLARPRAIRTACATWARRRDRTFLAYAGAVGRWAWNHDRLPGALLLDAVALFRTDALAAGSLVVGGDRADLRRLRHLPLLAVTTAGDHVVPPASTLALAAVPGLDVRSLACTAGHVAMLAGPSARAELYPGLARWLAEHDPPVTAPRRTGRARPGTSPRSLG